MKDKLFVDTDVVLDIALRREPFFQSSIRILSLIETRAADGYVSALSISNIYYIISKVDNRKSAGEFISKLGLFIKILAVDDEIINLALRSKFADFEDAVQYYCACRHKMDYILTRNVRDYAKARIKVNTPEEYLNSKNSTRIR